MFLEIITLLNLAAVGATAWTVRRLSRDIDDATVRVQATVTNESDRLGREVHLARHQNFWLHHLARRYVGYELIERRLLPLLGHKEPTGLTEFEDRLEDAFRKQAAHSVERSRTVRATSDAPRTVRATSEAGPPVAPGIDCGTFGGKQ